MKRDDGVQVSVGWVRCFLYTVDAKPKVLLQATSIINNVSTPAAGLLPGTV
jgi:hypothetical protein